MRILILSAMVAGSMAGCTSGNVDMLVMVGYADAATAGADFSTGGQWGHASLTAGVTTVREVFANVGNISNVASANGGIQGVPWPLSTGAYTGSLGASNFTVAISITGVTTSPSDVFTGALCFRVDTTRVTGNVTSASSSCATPELKMFDAAGCATSDAIASPVAAAGHPAAGWMGAATAGIALSGIAIYGKAHTATADDPTASFVAAAGFTKILLKFYTADDCTHGTDEAVMAATVVAAQSFALWTNSDAITNAATVPGRCVNVKKDVSFEFYCDVPGGLIKHIGYATQNCTGTPLAANTTTWANGASADLTDPEMCQQWKGVTGLYAAIANSAGARLTTQTLYTAVCPTTTTAAPTAAPASGAAAVGTAAAVAAGAAALIL